MSNKYFIITIDTEADNQWDSNQKCTTNNSIFLPRFQELAEKYNYKPVWLTTYEMANDDFFVNYFKKKQDDGLCEIGMHLHAWNNPPYYKLNKCNDVRSYLVEYPVDVMDKKIMELDKLLTTKFKIKPISHRAGRWATNNIYFDLLLKHGYKIDCSVTPHVDWRKQFGETGMPGSDYSKSSETIKKQGGILEIPVTIRRIHCFQINKVKSIKNLFGEIIRLIKGRTQWVRPDSTFSTTGIKKIIKKCSKKDEYIMFMIHSSELMPSGSPNFKTKNDIEKLYIIIEKIFVYCSKLGYKGITLKELYNNYEGIGNNE